MNGTPRFRSALGLLLTSSLVAAACKDGPPAGPAATAATPARPADAAAPSPCETLARQLCARFGSGSDVCGLVDAQARRRRPERCAELLGRYDQVVQELEELREAERAIASDSRPSGGRVPAVGPADAEITVVLFSDFQCSDCARASGMVRALRTSYGDRIRLLFRQLPRPEHPHARLAAEASLAANAQGKFWEYHDVLFANPHDLGRAALERYARAVHLDLPAFRSALDRGRFVADVEADLALGRKLFLAEAPAVFVNGKRVAVPYGVDELSELLGPPAREGDAPRPPDGGASRPLAR